MDSFYRNRMLLFANGRIPMHPLLMEKLLAKCKYITSKSDMEVVTSEEVIVYCVPSETDRQLMYEVDAVLCICSCPSGMADRCCKHQIAVYKWFNMSLPNVPPVTDAARYSAARLALGDEAPSAQFYASMTATDMPADPHLVSVCRVLSTYRHV